MDNSFINGLIKYLPSNDRGNATEVEKGVETMKKNAILAGIAGGISTLGLALWQHWRDRNVPKNNNKGFKNSNFKNKF